MWRILYLIYLLIGCFKDGRKQMGLIIDIRAGLYQFPGGFRVNVDLSKFPF